MIQISVEIIKELVNHIYVLDLKSHYLSFNQTTLRDTDMFQLRIFLYLKIGANTVLYANKSLRKIYKVQCYSSNYISFLRCSIFISNTFFLHGNNL